MPREPGEDDDRDEPPAEDGSVLCPLEDALDMITLGLLPRPPRSSDSTSWTTFVDPGWDSTIATLEEAERNTLDLHCKARGTLLSLRRAGLETPLDEEKARDFAEALRLIREVLADIKERRCKQQPQPQT